MGPAPGTNLLGMAGERDAACVPPMPLPSFARHLGALGRSICTHHLASPVLHSWSIHLPSALSLATLPLSPTLASLTLHPQPSHSPSAPTAQPSFLSVFMAWQPSAPRGRPTVQSPEAAQGRQRQFHRFSRAAEWPRPHYSGCQGRD